MWLRQKRLERRKKIQARRLSEIQTGLQNFRARDIRVRFEVKSQLIRIRELKKQLNKVKSEEELRFWRSLFNMCVPSFKALLSASQKTTQTRRLKKGVKK
jgi:hypothetical protein